MGEGEEPSDEASLLRSRFFVIEPGSAGRANGSDHDAQGIDRSAETGIPLQTANLDHGLGVFARFRKSSLTKKRLGAGDFWRFLANIQLKLRTHTKPHITRHATNANGPPSTRVIALSSAFL